MAKAHNRTGAGQEPSIDEAPAELEHYNRDVAYYQRNWERLLQAHPDKWVAIFGERVVAVSDDLDELITELKRQQIPPGDAVREFLSTEDVVLILRGE